MQLFNAESHTFGVKRVHGIDDAIAKFIFDECVEKNGYVYFRDKLTYNDSYNFHAIVLLC